MLSLCALLNFDGFFCIHAKELKEHLVRFSANLVDVNFVTFCFPIGQFVVIVAKLLIAKVVLFLHQGAANNLALIVIALLSLGQIVEASHHVTINF